MGIKEICNTVKNYFKNTRQPFPILPGLLIVCSMNKRPGLSVIQSTANIVSDLEKLGIPTGPMPDGSDNKTVGYTWAITKEIFRAWKFDMILQGACQPASMNIVVAGAGGGFGNNVNTGVLKFVPQ